jgi:hypothetical protein
MPALAQQPVVMSDRVALNPGWWFALHVIFGVVLMITPGLRRQFALTVPERAEEALRAA